MLTHIHTVVYTWWCWHIYKGDGVRVDVDQLGDGTEVRRVWNSTGALYRKDRVSQSGPDARVLRPVSGGQEHVASVFNQTLALEVTGRWQGASGQANIR